MMVNVQNRQQSGRIKTDCWYCQNIKSRKLVNTWDTADSLLPTMPSKLNKNSLQLMVIVVYLLVYLVTDSQTMQQLQALSPTVRIP